MVKVFNNIFFKHPLNLARPAGAADRSSLPIAGDSAAAKAAVTDFLDSIGYGAVDAGTLADGWRQQRGRRPTGRLTGRSTTRRALPPAPRSSAWRWPPRPGR